MKTYQEHRRMLLAVVLLELIEDPDLEASEISDAIMDELEDIHAYHAERAEKAAKVIKFLGG